MLVVFAGGGGAIMAGGAVIDDTGVIKLGANEGRGVMTYGTIECG